MRYLCLLRFVRISLCVDWKSDNLLKLVESIPDPNLFNQRDNERVFHGRDAGNREVLLPRKRNFKVLTEIELDRTGHAYVVTTCTPATFGPVEHPGTT